MTATASTHDIEECTAGVRPASYSDAIRIFAKHDDHNPYLCKAWVAASAYLSEERNEGQE